MSHDRYEEPRDKNIQIKIYKMLTSDDVTDKDSLHALNALCLDQEVMKFLENFFIEQNLNNLFEICRPFLSDNKVISGDPSIAIICATAIFSKMYVYFAEKETETINIKLAMNVSTLTDDSNRERKNKNILWLPEIEESKSLDAKLDTELKANNSAVTDNLLMAIDHFGFPIALSDESEKEFGRGKEILINTIALFRETSANSKSSLEEFCIFYEKLNRLSALQLVQEILYSQGLQDIFNEITNFINNKSPREIDLESYAKIAFIALDSFIYYEKELIEKSKSAVDDINNEKADKAKTSEDLGFNFTPEFPINKKTHQKKMLLRPESNDSEILLKMVKQVTDNMDFWRGKHISKTGFTKNRTPEIIIKINELITNQPASDSTLQKIINLAIKQQEFYNKNQNSFMGQKANPDTTAFLNALTHLKLDKGIEMLKFIENHTLISTKKRMHDY